MRFSSCWAPSPSYSSLLFFTLRCGQKPSPISQSPGLSSRPQPVSVSDPSSTSRNCLLLTNQQEPLPVDQSSVGRDWQGSHGVCCLLCDCVIERNLRFCEAHRHLCAEWCNLLHVLPVRWALFWGKITILVMCAGGRVCAQDPPTPCPWSATTVPSNQYCLSIIWFPGNSWDLSTSYTILWTSVPQRLNLIHIWIVNHWK